MSTTSINIIGKETVSKAVDEAARSLRGLNTVAATIANSFKILDTVGAVIQGIGQAVGEVLLVWAEQERALIGFGTAVNQAGQLSSGAAGRLGEFADSMASLTGSERQSILSLETFLATAGRTEDQITRIIEVAADMSVATGVDMDSAVRTLNKSFGGLAGELGEAIPEIKSLTEEQLKAGGAVEFLARRYDGLAEALGTSTDVSLKNFSNAWKDLMASFGGAVIAPLFTPMVEWITTIITKWTDALSEVNRYRVALKLLNDEDPKTRARAAVDVAKIDADRASRESAQGMKSQGLDQGFEKWRQRTGGTAGDFTTLVADYLSEAVSTQKIYDRLKAAFDLQFSAAPGVPGGGAGGGAGSGGTPEPTDWYLSPQYADRWERTKPEALFPLIGAGNTGASTAGMGDMSEMAMVSFGENTTGNMGDMSEAVQVGGTDTSSVYDAIERGRYRQTPVALPEYKGAMIKEAISNVFGDLMGPLAEQFTSLAGPIGRIQQLLDPVGLIIQGFMETIGPALTQTIQPLFDALKGVGQVLAEALFPILNALAPVFTILADVIGRNVVMLVDLLAPIIEIIVGVLEVVLVPILKVLSVAFEILMSPVKFLGDLFAWVGTAIKNAVHNLVEYIDHPINDANRKIWTTKAFSSDAFTGLADRIAEIWNGYSGGAASAWSASMAGGESSAPGGAPGSSFVPSGGNASYSKPRDITVNVQLNTPALVGEGGFRDFALMISRELMSAGVLAVT